MIDLRPCSECRRHVDVSASECPFCRARLEPAPPPVMLPRGRRFTRAAVFAGATLLGAATGVACGGGEETETETETEVSTETETETEGGDTGGGDTGGGDTGGGEDPDHATPMPYGAPPARDRRLV